MYIDGQFIVVTDEHVQQARQQLELPADFQLVDGTRTLQHDTGNGVVQIPLPGMLMVAVFENMNGKRCYGVVSLEGLGYSIGRQGPNKR